MKDILRYIRTHLLIGAVLVTPLAVTLWVIVLLVNLLTTSKLSRWAVSPVVDHLPGPESTAIQGLTGLAIVLTVLFIIGVVFRNIFGRRLYNLLDKLLERTPLINRVYMFVRGVSQSIVSQKESMFKKVVMIEYPRPGMRSIAFLSTRVPPSLQAKCLGGEKVPHVYVFLPTTPNPTSGFLLLVPEKDTVTLDMSTTEAMRLIVSAGAAEPDEPDTDQVPTLLDKIEEMLERRRIRSLGSQHEPPADLNTRDNGAHPAE